MNGRRALAHGLMAGVVMAAIAFSQLAGAVALPGPAVGQTAAPNDAQELLFGFPMKGDEFLARVNEKLAKARAEFERKLAKSDASESKKSEIRRRFDQGVARVRDAAQRAAADGTVTREEADQVRALADQLKNIAN